jgi:beta-barrel assembly-enhancing protease
MADAIYYDGQSAKDHAVTVRLEGHLLIIVGNDLGQQSWTLSGLHPIDRPASDQPFRLTHDEHLGARLVLRDQEFVNTLITKQPNLKGGVTGKQIFHVGGWIVGGFAALAVLGYLFLTLLPQQVAHIMPDTWRNSVGEQIEKSVVAGAKLCTNPQGISALGALVASISEGSSELPAIAVKVYDMPIMNAFAAAGDRIILTRELLATASDADEVAGVVAHEMGHVVHRHSEAQMVRVTGLQVLLSVATGSSNGDTVSSVSGLAAVLQYSRDAEREADEFALATLEKASINPLGFKRFFEKVLALEGEASSGTLGKIGNMFSTHPGTKDRIAAIKPLPEGVIARAPLTEKQWQDLRKICE